MKQNIMFAVLIITILFSGLFSSNRAFRDISTVGSGGRWYTLCADGHQYLWVSSGITAVFSDDGKPAKCKE